MFEFLKDNLLKALAEVKDGSFYSKHDPARNYVAFTIDERDQSRLILTTTNRDEVLTAHCPIRLNGEFTPFLAPMITKYVSDKSDVTCTSYPIHDWLKVTKAVVFAAAYDPGTRILTLSTIDSYATFNCKPWEKL